MDSRWDVRMEGKILPAPTGSGETAIYASRKNVSLWNFIA
jgi:hypothetical protein